MVGVINKVKFIRNGSSKFKNFIDYIDRSEATRKKILIKLNRMVVICGKKFLVLIMNF